MATCKTPGSCVSLLANLPIMSLVVLLGCRCWKCSSDAGGRTQCHGFHTYGCAGELHGLGTLHSLPFLAHCSCGSLSLQRRSERGVLMLAVPQMKVLPVQPRTVLCVSMTTFHCIQSPCSPCRSMSEANTEACVPKSFGAGAD